MIVFNVEVNPASVRNFERACERFEKDLGDSQGTALRRGTLTFLKMVRSQTRRSPKVVPRKEISKSYLPPKWIKRGHSGKPLRRMQLIRWGHGTNWLDHRYVYGGEYVRGPKGGQRVRPFSEAQMRKEAQNNYGQIRNWGLAKRSWGWFMKAMFHQSMQDENPKSRIDSRMVKKEIREVHTAGKAGVEITLTNKLVYIRSAMPPGAINHALRAATRQINGFINEELKKRAAQFGKGS